MWVKFDGEKDEIVVSNSDVAKSKEDVKIVSKPYTMGKWVHVCGTEKETYINVIDETKEEEGKNETG